MFCQPSNCQVEIYEGGTSARYQYPVPQPVSAWHYREEAAHFLLGLSNDTQFDSSGQDSALDVWIFEEISQAAHQQSRLASFSSAVMRRFYTGCDQGVQERAEDSHSELD